MPAVKITTVGNSLGIVLPREVLQRLRVDKGSLLYLVETHNGVELVPYEPTFAAQVEALEQAARSDRDVLRALALYRSPMAAADLAGNRAPRVPMTGAMRPSPPAGRRSRASVRAPGSEGADDVSVPTGDHDD